MSALRAHTSVESNGVEHTDEIASSAPPSRSELHRIPSGSAANSNPKGHSRQHSADHRMLASDAAPEKPLTDSRAKTLQRYLSAQTDVDDEVLQLYKLVCRL